MTSFDIFVALSTYKEPFPGWVDAYQGLNTALARLAVGLIHVLYGDESANCDIVPADYASNALIASAWDCGTIQRRYFYSFSFIIDFRSFIKRFIVANRHQMQKKSCRVFGFSYPT